MSQLISLVDNFGLKEIGLIILALSIFIDISPAVKFNPWKWAFGKFGKYINTSIEKEIGNLRTEMNTKINELKEEQKIEFEDIRQEQTAQSATLNRLILDLNYKELSRLRWEVTDFEANIAHGNKYPREQYRHILDDAEKYLRMIEEGKDLIIDAEDTFRIKEATEKIRTHYEESKKSENMAFMI